jgi:hypothetical protein
LAELKPRGTSRVQAINLQLLPALSERTEELVANQVFADFDAEGRLVSLEVFPEPIPDLVREPDTPAASHV